MPFYKKYVLFMLLTGCLFLNGCALLQLPGTILNGVFNVLGQVIKSVGNMPLPPPWIFI